jgi:hypothetical protein
VAAKNAAARRQLSIKCGIRAAFRRSDAPSPRERPTYPMFFDERNDPMSISQSKRSMLLGACAALAFGATLLHAGTTLAQQKMKVAAIYTVPVEQ